jgi:F-type H+-transporting ATPase subunit b
MLSNGNVNKHTIASILIIPILLFLYCPVIASDVPQLNTSSELHSAEADMNLGDGHSSDRGGDLLDLLYRGITFVLVLIILFVVIKKMKLKDFLSTRSEEIKKRLDDLKRDKEEAENRYKEAKRRLRDFESKRTDIIERYKKEGQAEKEKIITEAKERVRQIIDQSELAIQQEIESARNRLKQDVIELAAEKAREILANEMGEDDQEKMVIEFVEKVGKVN